MLFGCEPSVMASTILGLWTGVQKEPRSGVIGVQSGPLILMV